MRYLETLTNEKEQSGFPCKAWPVPKKGFPKESSGITKGSLGILTVFLRINFRWRRLCQIFVSSLFNFTRGKITNKSFVCLHFSWFPFQVLITSFHIPFISSHFPFISFPGRGPNPKTKKSASRKCIDFLISFFIKILVGGPLVSTCPVRDPGVVN